MDDEGGWSGIAAEWAELWGEVARPAQEVLIDAAGIGAGTRVLDVGCGSGEFLALLRERGAEASGVDPAEGMRRLAARTGAEVRAGDVEHLPFPDAGFDAVTIVSALDFAEDAVAGLRECGRVLRPGGVVAVAGWAEPARNDIGVIARAVAAADGEPEPAFSLRAEGEIEAAMRSAGLRVAASGVVRVPWPAADDDALVGGILLGEDEGFLAEMRPVVIGAASPFRTDDGYVLHNAFRWAVGAR
jgi:SAM-dependent methyltransferase